VGKLGGFLQIERHGIVYRDPVERAHDYREFLDERPVAELREQGARCMDCGVPFCHNGCPLGNLIPDWNDLVYRDRWREAIAQLHATNNFPDFTGRLCPAPCEAACVLEIREGEAVTIKQIELAIVDHAFREGWVVPEPPRHETGQSVAVVGSGPAGMAAAQQLRRAGHAVTLFERDEAAGGLVRFGVPDFKIEKWIVQRRVQQLVDEGVELRCGVEVGGDVSAEELRASYDAIVLATGSRVPRDLPVPGRELRGVQFAMDFLPQQNRVVAGDRVDGHTVPAPGGPEPAVPAPGGPEPAVPAPGGPEPAVAAPGGPEPAVSAPGGPEATVPTHGAAVGSAETSALQTAASGETIVAAGKHVVVIGGGDTGADCVGNALREGAASIVQLELLPEPPARRPDDRTPWPEWPAKFRLSYAMEEARTAGLGEQDYSVATTSFSGDPDGNVAALHIAQAQPAPPFGPQPGTERELPAQLVLLAMGFLHPEQGLLDQLGVEKDPRGNVKAVRPYTTSVEGVFAAGDARRGQSLIVWAINEGRQCARMVDRYLAGLPADRGSHRSLIGGVAGGAARPEDEGIPGHADADEGPEGPPQHVGPGVPAGQ
jgi:glutamate synthase (NADPH/NADH) small chain